MYFKTSTACAHIVERAASQWRLPNGYILGQEATGAFVGGLRYGKGMLYTKNASDLPVYWRSRSALEHCLMFAMVAGARLRSAAWNSTPPMTGNHLKQAMFSPRPGLVWMRTCIADPSKASQYA
jgi:hypothetical protein